MEEFDQEALIHELKKVKQFKQMAVKNGYEEDAKNLEEKIQQLEAMLNHGTMSEKENL